MTRRELIEDTVADLVIDFLYYDRRGDDDELPVGSIEAAVKAGEISTDEIVQLFRSHLEARFSGQA